MFFIGSLFLSSLVSTTPLSCISMNNLACKVRPEIVNVSVMNPYFIILVLKQVNVVVAVTIMKLVYVNVDYIKAFVTLSNVGMMINVDANVKNWLIKVYAIKDMLGMLVIVSVNVINHVMLVSV